MTKKTIDEKINELDHVAHKIILSFQESGLDEAYIADKVNRLHKNKNKYESLDWACHNLDSVNLPIFANKLGISLDDAKTLSRVFKKV